jgi:hypothetical protein
MSAYVVRTPCGSPAACRRTLISVTFLFTETLLWLEGMFSLTLRMWACRKAWRGADAKGGQVSDVAQQVDGSTSSRSTPCCAPAPRCGAHAAVRDGRHAGGHRAVARDGGAAAVAGAGEEPRARDARWCATRSSRWWTRTRTLPSAATCPVRSASKARRY